MRNQYNHQCHATSGTSSLPETPHGHHMGAFGDTPAWSVLIPSTASPPTVQRDGQGFWDIPAKAVQSHKHPQHWEGRWLSTKHSAGTKLRNSVFRQCKVLQSIKVETPAMSSGPWLLNEQLKVDLVHNFLGGFQQADAPSPHSAPPSSTNPATCCSTFLLRALHLLWTTGTLLHGLTQLLLKGSTLLVPNSLWKFANLPSTHFDKLSHIGEFSLPVNYHRPNCTCRCLEISCLAKGWVSNL